MQSQPEVLVTDRQMSRCLLCECHAECDALREEECDRLQEVEHDVRRDRHQAQHRQSELRVSEQCPQGWRVRVCL